MKNIVFANACYLWLLLLIPLMVFWYYRNHHRIKPSLLFSGSGFMNEIKPSFKCKIFHVPFILRMSALALLIVALARPQSRLKLEDVSTEGIDIILSVDISGSMLAEDFKPNRLEAAKKVARNFIKQRPSDNIGLVVFAGEAFTRCPSTIDHNILLEFLNNVKSGIIKDGTAIGDGLAVSINRIRDSKAKSKVIILLTDGVNNMGFIDPLTSAEIAKNEGIRIYTIGVGKQGFAPYPYPTPWGIQYQNVEVEIDEPLLKTIAQSTGGTYFRSTNNVSLENIFHEIDQMEKSIIAVSHYNQKKEEAFPFIIIAMFCILAEIALRVTVLRTYP